MRYIYLSACYNRSRSCSGCAKRWTRSRQTTQTDRKFLYRFFLDWTTTITLRTIMKQSMKRPLMVSERSLRRRTMKKLLEMAMFIIRTHEITIVRSKLMHLKEIVNWLRSPIYNPSLFCEECLGYFRLINSRNECYLYTLLYLAQIVLQIVLQKSCIYLYLKNV